jgi:hypothetical protein
LKITRLGLLQAFGFNTGPYVRTITSDESMSHIAMEMRSPRALRRLARIERYAFRTKFALALIAMYSVHNPPFTKSHESVHSINTPGVIERPLNLPLNSEDVQATRSPDQKTDPEE